MLCFSGTTFMGHHCCSRENLKNPHLKPKFVLLFKSIYLHRDFAEEILRLNHSPKFDGLNIKDNSSLHCIKTEI